MLLKIRTSHSSLLQKHYQSPPLLRSHHSSQEYLAARFPVRSALTNAVASKINVAGPSRNQRVPLARVNNTRDTIDQVSRFISLDLRLPGGAALRVLFRIQIGINEAPRINKHRNRGATVIRQGVPELLASGVTGAVVIKVAADCVGTAAALKAGFFEDREGGIVQGDEVAVLEFWTSTTSTEVVSLRNWDSINSSSSRRRLVPGRAKAAGTRSARRAVE